MTWETAEQLTKLHVGVTAVVVLGGLDWRLVLQDGDLGLAGPRLVVVAGGVVGHLVGAHFGGVVRDEWC